MSAQPATPGSNEVPMGPFQQSGEEDFAGEWIRSDGQYRLSIQVSGGEVRASYFNPKPINVESAVFLDDTPALLLEIVLVDDGYPGSTYRLSYIPEYEVLSGTYTIPGNEANEVYFVPVLEE